MLASTSKPDTGEVERTSSGRPERMEQAHRTQNARTPNQVRVITGWGAAEVRPSSSTRSAEATV